MKNSKTLFQDFVKRITLQEERDEIQSIAYLVFENIFGLTKTQILAEKPVTQNLSQQNRLDEIADRINQHEPVQYILGECFFYGRIFKITPSVLIPRPETEELVRLIINYTQQQEKSHIRILDVGTGSGCIAATLSLEIQDAEIFATDVSKDALNVASANVERLGAKVQFQRHDILQTKLPVSIDIIVSNPPYIAWNERNTMSKNVVEYEPELALFVDSDDPLLFYKALVTRATESLTPNGLLAVEINERFGKELQRLFIENNFYDVQVIQDLVGKDRIVKGVLSS